MLTFSSSFAAPALAGWMGALAIRGATLAGLPTAAASGDPVPAPADDGVAPVSAVPDGAEPSSAATTESGGAEPKARYWPCERLNAFMLQMAAHGHCVNAAMMLGHRPYAQQQLAQALQVPDEALQALASELQTYFDAPPESAALQEVARGEPAPDGLH